MRHLRKASLGLVMAVAASVPAAAEVTIAALGDSLTQGYGLPVEQGFVPQLEAWLRGRGHEVTVLNAGVSGDTTAGGLSRVDWTLTPEVAGMIVALGANDMLRGIDPGTSRANLRGILQAAADSGVEVLLVGIEAPGNYGPEYKRDFDGMYPELAEDFGALYSKSFLSGLEDPPDPAAMSGRYLQSDGLHPNAEGVALMVESLGPQVQALLERIDGGAP